MKSFLDAFGVRFCSVYRLVLPRLSEIENHAANWLFGFPEVNPTEALKEAECFRHWVEVLFKYLTPFCKSSLSSPKVIQYIIDLYKNIMSHT